MDNWENIGSDFDYVTKSYIFHVLPNISELGESI
jgi:hypothetical protein